MPSRPIPVRLTPAVIDRIDAVAVRAGLDRSDVIKLCLNRFLDELGSRPEMLLRDWAPVLKELDGRALRYSETRQASLRVAESSDDNSEENVQPKARKNVNYREALKADRKKKKAKP